MIHYYKHQEIDKKKWDAAIEASFNGNIYALSWYLDAVSPGWEALVKGEYLEVMPLTCKRKWCIDYLRPAFITQQLGVFSIKEKQIFAVDDFIAAIPEKFKWIDIYLNHFNKYHYSDKFLNANYELSLAKNHQTLTQGYSTNTRRNLKKAYSEELSVSEVFGIEPIIQIFKNHKGSLLPSVKEDYYDALKRVYQQSKQGPFSEAYLVEQNGKAIAGALFFKFKGRITFIFSASSAEAKNSKAMFFLIDNFIKNNSGRELILDFEGSNIESLAKFY
nr:hypothetical protein [Bacteroidota bacterium]